MYPLKTRAPYNPSNLAATPDIYTTMYLWNYITWDYNEWVWSHPWVDIMPQVKNDNIYACLDWVVHFAWTSDANWNYIVLKHEWAPDPDNLSNKTTLYSCHLHLSEMSVKTWDSVKEGFIIWKSWNTWNSTWEHLHFQIDRKDAPFHPYWPFSFKEAQAAWLGFFEAVNSWFWRENAEVYTVNPLVYLDKVKAFKWTTSPTDSSFTVTTTTTTTTTFATKSKYFSDVKDDVTEIDFLRDSWIIKWYEDGTFRPETNISRLELLAMVIKFAKIEVIDSWTCNFSDVSKNDWGYKYIVTASQKGIIKWYEDGTFRPWNTVTRAEAIAIVLNTIVWKDNIPKPMDSDYQDVQTSDWYCKYTNFVSQNWLLDSIWRFYPNYNMKRRELAVLLYNLRDRVWR